MDLLFNDLSLRGQFRSARDFEESIGRVMEMREVARRFGLDVYCPRSVAYARVVGDMPMQQAVSFLGEDARSALMAWLTREGPFMESVRQHGGDDYLACGDDVVTDTAVGEAAYCRFSGVDRRLVSLFPSAWNFSPVPVVWHNGGSKSVDVENYWEREALQRRLESAPPPMKTWRDMEETVRIRYATLTFSDDAFEPIRPLPFDQSAAERIIRILGILYDLKHSFDEQGERTKDWQDLHRKHFVGEKAWFSDSSDGEKARFANELTFRNPLNPNEDLFCTWHGKVKTIKEPVRVHYHWRSMSADAPVYIVYVGPKITKR